MKTQFYLINFIFFKRKFKFNFEITTYYGLC